MDVESITPSKVTTYLACPRKFAFRYVEQVPPAFKPAALAFGSAVHTALEAFHRKCLDGEPVSADEIVSLFLSDWAAQQVDDLRFKEGEDAASLQALGVALIKAYVTANPDLRVRAVEWPFAVPLVDPETGEVIGPDVHGVFDLVLDGDVIVELKTAARAYDAGTLARNLQFSAYAYAYRRLYGRDPLVRVTALLKQKKPRIDTYEAPRTPEDDVRFVRVAAAVAKAIRVEAFPPNPGWQCDDCEYAGRCEAVTIGH